MTGSSRFLRTLPAIALAILIALTVACSSDARSEPMTVEAPPASAGSGSTATTVERPAGAVAPAPAPAGGAQAAAEPDADRAYEHIRRLASEIGDRVSGADEEHQAAEYIADVLRGYGYDVEMQRFPVSAFISRRVSLETESPQRQAIKAQPLTNSRPGQFTGEVVYAGVGRDGDFTEAARGKIALVQRDGQITHQQKATAAAAAGAKALVIFNSGDDLFLGELSQNAPPIPVLSISGVEGRALRDRAQAGTVRASLLFEGGRETRDSINVVARPPGARCQALLGGHYDSVANAPGASDNASGTAAVIEMARVQAARGNPEQACFAAFGSEETGLDGSRAFVRAISAEEKSALRFMLNFDMVAVGTEWLLIGTPALQQQGKAILNGMGLDGRATTLLGASSDHASFINAGIPALFLHRSDDPLLHTPEDVLDRIDRQALGESMRIGLAMLAGINPT